MTQPNKHSAPFREMAERIDRNAEPEFAGAILLVPPNGDPIAVLLTDPKPDTEAFWSLAKGKVDLATQELLQQRRGGFHQR